MDAVHSIIVFTVRKQDLGVWTATIISVGFSRHWLHVASSLSITWYSSQCSQWLSSDDDDDDDETTERIKNVIFIYLFILIFHRN